MKHYVPKKIVGQRRKSGPREYYDLFVEVYFDSKSRVRVKTRVKVEPHMWDKKKKQVVETDNAFILNDKLKSIVTELDRMETECYLNDEPFTPARVAEYQRKLDSPDDNSHRLTFNQFFEREIENDPTSNARYKCDMRRTLALLNEFNGNISFGELGKPSFAREWDTFLKRQETINSQNTVWRHHRNTKKFVNLATRYKYLSMDDHPYNGFKVKTEKSKRLALDFAELERVWEYRHPDKTTDNDRKIFLFACYTGFRVSDIMNLETKYFSRTSDGLAIDLDKIIKVKRPIKFPVELLFDGRAVEIIKDFLAPEEFGRLGYLNNGESRKVFGRLYPKRVNSSLKTIRTECDIIKPLSMHVGRHTFGTNLAELTNDPYLIMDLMGISQISTAMIYIHSSRERTNRKLRNIEWNPLKRELREVKYTETK